jgi:cytochrome P450
VTTAPSMDEMLGAVDVVDPYPLWQSLLDGGPLVAADGSFALLSSHADCDAVLRNGRFSSDRRNSARFQAVAAAMSPADRARLERQRSFLFLDPPDHTRLRRLVSKAFTPRTVDRLEPLVEELTAQLLDAAAARGRLELVEDLAYPLPVTVISRMLGVPEQDHVRFAGWSAVLARSLDDTLSAGDAAEIALRRQAVDDFRAYFDELVELRRRDPQDDLLTALAAAEDDGDRLSGDELLSTLMLLLIAGHETTVNLIANGTLALLRDDALRAQVAVDPACAAGVVEEVLRLDPPPPAATRCSTPTRCGWTPRGPPGTWRSAPARTSASAPRWPGSRAASPSPRWPAGWWSRGSASWRTARTGCCADRPGSRWRTRSCARPNRPAAGRCGRRPAGPACGRGSRRSSASGPSAAGRRPRRGRWTGRAR